MALFRGAKKSKGRYYIIRLKIQGFRHERRTSNNSIFDRWEKSLGDLSKARKKSACINCPTLITFPLFVPPAAVIRSMQGGGENKSRALLALGSDGNALNLFSHRRARRYGVGDM